MRILLLAIGIFFSATQCASFRKAVPTTPSPEVSMYFSYADIVNNEPQLHFAITNHLPDTIVILRPLPAKDTNRFVPAAVPPDFFQLTLLPETALCEYAPFDSGTSTVKTPEDFLLLGPNEQRTIRVDPNHYFQGICDENINTVKGVLKYQYDPRYVEDTAFFNARIKKKGRLSDTDSEALLDLLRRSYRKEITTDTFTVNWEALRNW